jgi:hypothetical protein
VVDAAPSVVDAAPSVVDAAPSVVDAAPSVVDAAPSVVDAAPSVLAAVRATCRREEISSAIRSGLDRVWPVIRAQSVKPGHNVVVYREMDGGLAMEVGVQVGDGFVDDGDVMRVETPAGRAATIAHFGEYSTLGGAYGALHRWCADHGLHPAGVSWEVYGDWDEDPAKLRTDIYLLLGPGPARPS